MNYIANKNEINSTVESVRNFSFEEKKNNTLDEKSINSFLDKINDFKIIINKKNNRLENLIQIIEHLTWLEISNDESLLLINDLISSLRDLKTSLNRQYISMATLRSKGICKTEIKIFKMYIDDLEEIANDLESIYFFLPNNTDFQDVTNKLSLI